MREVKRDRDARDAVRREPFVGEPVVRPEHETAGGELGVELRDARLEIGAGDGQPEIAHADLEQLLVAERRPVGRLQRFGIGGACFGHSVSRS